MARLYANENFPLPVVEDLRKLGHDVLTTYDSGKTARKIFPGALRVLCGERLFPTHVQEACMDQQAPPAYADVIIISAGIVGCSAAYFLAKRGANVVVVEKGEVADEQSGRNWGWTRQQGRHPWELPLTMRSIQLWSQFSKDLDTDIEWIPGGSLRLAYTEEDMARYEAWTQEARPLGLDTRVLSRQEIKGLIPAMEGPWLGG